MVLTPTAVIMTVAKVLLWLVICCAVADLVVGVVHWAEDSYGQEHWPIIGPLVITPNLLHHAKPRALLANTWWQSADIQVYVGSALLAAAAWGGWVSWQLVVITVLAVNGNEVHKWAHRTRAENGKLITWLQEHHLIQGRAHHGLHHGGNRNTHYCTLTCWMNRILERMRFWRGLEACITALTGVVPRIDPVVLARMQSAGRA